MLSGQFKAVAVVGPRQSGKTTLTRSFFPKKKYVSLESPIHRQFAEEDSRGFLAQFPEGAILDEVQRVPSIFSYLQAKLLPESINKLLFKGSYPPVYHQDIPPEKWFPNYIKTCVERDMRLIKNISDLAVFERFLKLCAGRTGQLLNKNSLGIEVGVDSKTIAFWLSILESSFIVHFVTAPSPEFQ